MELYKFCHAKRQGKKKMSKSVYKE